MPENVNTSELSLQQIDAVEDKRPVMIKVDHVSMSFNMASEQMNSLKEYAVAIAKRKLFFEEFKALDDVSFEVRKGDVFGIMGTNGSGKSTMLKIIAGVLEPTKGSCQVNGNIAPLIELGAGFDMDLSARENIYLNGALLGYSKHFIDENFADIVEFAEVEKFLDMPLKNYSSGMVARIAFAIATVIVPEILVVDEVLSVGDFRFQKKCEDRIAELIEQHGVTVLIVSHSNDQVARLCNKAIWIEKGHERLLGDASLVCRAYGGLGGRVGSAEAEQEIFDALVQSGCAEEDILYEDLSADSSVSLSVRAISKLYQGKHVDTLLMAVDDSHLNALVANSVAGALSAPLISVKGDHLSDAVGRMLYEMTPKKIVVFDVAEKAAWAVNELGGLPWHPEVKIEGGRGKTAYDYCFQVFDQGRKNGFWGGESIAVADFSEVKESLAMMPLLYSQGTPIFVDIASTETFLSRVCETIASCSTSTVYCSCTETKALLEPNAGSQVDLPVADTQFVLSQNASDSAMGKSEIVVAPWSMSQWPYLLWCGCYAGNKEGALLLLDHQSLDGMASGLDYLGRNKSLLGPISFIDGSIPFEMADKEMLAWKIMD